MSMFHENFALPPDHPIRRRQEREVRRIEQAEAEQERADAAERRERNRRLGWPEEAE